jgi:hypothetical protein
MIYHRRACMGAPDWGETVMKNLLLASVSITGLILSLAAPAAAQTPCLVAQRGLNFQQWYQICAAQVAQTCRMLPMQPAACLETVAQSEYQTYVQSQSASMACSVPDLRQCINGWLATCNGQLFITNAQRC